MFFTASASTGLSELFMAVDLQRWFGNQSWFLQERRGRGWGWTDYKGGICGERFFNQFVIPLFPKKNIYTFDHWAVNTATRKSKYMDVSKQANRHKYVTDEYVTIKSSNKYLQIFQQ